MAPRYFQANRVFGGKDLGRFHQMCGTQQQSLRRRQTVRTLSTPSRPPEALQPLSSCTFLYIFLYLFKMFVRSVPVPSCQRSCEDISFNIGILLWLPDIFRPTGFLVERTWDASTKCVGPSSRASGGGRLCVPYPHLFALRRRFSCQGISLTTSPMGK